jgi:hypothetical protein
MLNLETSFKPDDDQIRGTLRGFFALKLSGFGKAKRPIFLFSPTGRRWPLGRMRGN